VKFKLDENFGSRTQDLFRSSGHEVETVRSQGLQGCSDQHLYSICCSERYCLVTLDLDFSDITRFPPHDASGIVVVRVPGNPSLALLGQLVVQLLQAISRMSVGGELWIVEPGRIRIHQTETDE
jgi:predicted nuclease of predicted toxin-antitoxin system